jgi:hypothetical protein
MKKFLTLLVAAIALVGSHASAQILTTETQTLTFTNVSAGSYSLDFNLFNTNLGVLQSVTINLGNVFVTGTASVTNNTNTNTGGTLPGSYNYSVQYTGTFDLTDSADNEVFLQVSAAPSSKKLAVGATLTTPTGSNSTAGASSTELDLGTDDLSLYEGAGSGTVSLTLATGNSVTATGTSNYSTTSSGTGSGAVSVTYTYLAPSATPEPSTWALMVGGCFALVLVARRRSAVRA